jgi:hypothetical protein
VTAGAAFPHCHWDGWDFGETGSEASLALPGQVSWAGLYWSGARASWEEYGGAAQDIELRGPGGDYQAVAASAVGEVAGPDGRSAFEAFADVTNLVAQYGAGVWSAAPAAIPDFGTAGFGWTLVVVTADPSAAPGTQVMVLDGAHVVDAADPNLSVPLDGLPPGQRAGVRTVTWTPAGPEISAFAQNLGESPAVEFTTGNVPYLVGVVAVTDPPQP